MAVVFDEVVGTVEPERGAEPADTTASAAGDTGPDAGELRRELARMAVRRARLFAD